MRQQQHERKAGLRGWRGVSRAWLVMASAGCVVSVAQTSDPNGKGKVPLPPPPASAPVSQSLGVRAALPSIRIGMPGRSGGLGGRPEPMGKKATLDRPVIQPTVQPAASAENIIPIGRPSDPAAIFREWRDFNAGRRSTRPELSEFAGAGNGKGSFSGAVMLHDPLNPQAMGDRGPFASEARYPSNPSSSTQQVLVNGVPITYTYSFQFGSGGSAILPYQAVNGVWGPFDESYGRRVISSPGQTYSDAALSARYDPQAVNQEKVSAAHVPSARERAVAAFESRDFSSAAAALKQGVKKEPGDRSLLRDLGVAELMSGKVNDGASSLARAYTADPSLADVPFTGVALGLTETDLRELCGRLVGAANRKPTVDGLVSAAVLLHGRGLVDPAVAMIERAQKAGLNSDVAGLLSRAMKPEAASGGSVPASTPPTRAGAKSRTNP